jgi:hypothetical protein
MSTMRLALLVLLVGLILTVGGLAFMMALAINYKLCGNLFC